jgi:hypothetical protein
MREPPTFLGKRNRRAQIPNLHSLLSTLISVTGFSSHRTADCILPFTFKTVKNVKEVKKEDSGLPISLFHKPSTSNTHIISSSIFIFKTSVSLP